MLYIRTASKIFEEVACDPGDIPHSFRFSTGIRPIDYQTLLTITGPKNIERYSFSEGSKHRMDIGPMVFVAVWKGVAGVLDLDLLFDDVHSDILVPFEVFDRGLVVGEGGCCLAQVEALQ